MESDQNPKTPFFRFSDRMAFWIATLVAFAVYFYTLAPSVTLEDSGEFAVAADWLGVPHPPGYPIWTILGWIFARVFSFVTFRGQPNPAWGIGMLSVVSGALAAGLTAMLISRSGADMLRQVYDTESRMSTRRADGICAIAGISASLLFAFSPVMWSQSVIIEAYSLHAFFLMLVFLLTYRWLQRPSDKVLWLTAFVFGLGMTNYQVLLFAMVPLVIVVLLRDTTLFRDFVLLGLPFAMTVGILKLGAVPPRTPGFFKHLPSHALEQGLDVGPALIDPGIYLRLAVLGGLVVLLCATAAVLRRRQAGRDAIRMTMGVAGVLFLVLFWYAQARVPSAPPLPVQIQPGDLPFDWTPWLGGFVLAVAALILLCLHIPCGGMYALAVLAVQVPLGILVYRGALLGLTHPDTLWFRFYVVLNFLFLGLGALMLPHGRRVSLTALMTELGLAFYVYMPIVSDLRNPPMNWGYPRTWEGFKHALTRGQYERLAPTNPFSMRFLEQLGSYFTDLRTQFTLMIAPLGLLPFCVWRGRPSPKRRGERALHAAIILFLISSAYVGIGEFLSWEQRGIFRLDKMVLSGLLGLWCVGAILIGMNVLEDYVRRLPDPARKLSERVTVALTLLGGGVVSSALLGRVLQFAFTTADSEMLPPLSLAALLGGGLLTLVLLGGIWVVKRALEREVDLRFDLNPLSQRWLIATAVGFFMMSVVLVWAANPKGDIQDLFIQKVKFISSHALYAVWIGYGLAFGLAFVDHWFGRKQWLFGAAVALTLALPLLPIEENYVNKELVRVYGAADQRGHDFGWQFGNYPLRGAEAILEELEPWEEPPPNPFYPPAMTPNAIFFGGTDPGRFVPTYMIFSARVRPDVFLITQNALADNTYMSVMRDLYGDAIWIPTPDDSARAFSVYVEEVQSGQRPRNAQLEIRDGRVQVSGALGVMEINGILCRMIHERNQARHDFYLEESYVIPWMFPYLTPHGLIMKLNAEPTEITSAMVRDDIDFWDWYVRRLLANRRFRRDVAAKKSFSKMRSALAGLYGARQMRAQSEHAFREALLLYRESPEAVFRLIHEQLLPQQRYEEVLDLLAEHGRLDPGSERVTPALQQVMYTRDLVRRAEAILAEAGPQLALTPQRALELADTYARLGRTQAMLQVLNPMLEHGTFDGAVYYEAANLLHRHEQSALAAEFMDLALTRLTAPAPEQLLFAAQLYGVTQQPEKMLAPLRRYLQMQPNDWQAWMDYATLHRMQNDMGQAQMALRRAIQLGGREAIEALQRNAYLRPVAESILDGGAGGLRGGWGAPR